MVRSIVRRLGVIAASATLLAIACKPTLNDTVSLVKEPRVLAVRADPAEAKPKDMITYTALVVDPNGDIATAPLDWAYCEARKPLAELEPVSPTCMTMSATFLTPIGGGASVSAPLPADACRQFGPEVPEPVDGGVAGRPVDPDPTGGYYQPLRIALLAPTSEVFTLAETRVACGLPGVTPEQSAEYSKRYHPNANPSIDALTANGESWPDASAGAASIGVGATVTLRASWADCAGATGPCSGAEPYVALDLATRALTDRREAMRVSWFTTAGSFANDHTGRDASDPATFSENSFTAPAQGGRVHVWVVLRDDRSGAAWREFVVDVR